MRSKADKDTIKAWKFFCTDCLKVDYTYIRFVGGENQCTHTFMEWKKRISLLFLQLTFQN